MWMATAWLCTSVTRRCMTCKLTQVHASLHRYTQAHTGTCITVCLSTIRPWCRQECLHVLIKALSIKGPPVHLKHSVTGLTCMACASAACMANASCTLMSKSRWKGSVSSLRPRALAHSTECRYTYASSSSVDSRLMRTWNKVQNSSVCFNDTCPSAHGAWEAPRVSSCCHLRIPKATGAHNLAGNAVDRIGLSIGMQQHCGSVFILCKGLGKKLP